MEANERRDAPSPFARSVGAAAACVVIGLLVCAFTYGARLFDFAPIKAVVALEDHLYDTIHPPVIRFTRKARTVVFVDIDEAALTAWGRRAAAPSNTPRDLIAGLTNAARAAGAAVVFLDFDFRNSLTEKEDEALHDELEAGAHGPRPPADVLLGRPAPGLRDPVRRRRAGGVADGLPDALSIRGAGSPTRRTPLSVSSTPFWPSASGQSHFKLSERGA
jgi:hypothetical protein